ncbi:YegS/Rv2252/BmrU family lipid kinase [Shouchella tritolerans]|uniref:YegS/Rv2252/BmrU family lipid kinase n=1 Tax=Shouchella tritolerans TaxID=2979466 RepID=UPI0021E91CCB|nr:YegS/Rv2252/BmrU family lipid kinase [Shouchella tritolerans]
MTSKRALMIYNPSSGRKRNHKKFPMVIEKLTSIGYDIRIHDSKDVAKLESLIKHACTNRWEALFVAGGDGTINTVFQFLSAEQYRPVVGIFPFGTSNEFAQVIGLPKNLFTILSYIEKGETSFVNIGKLGERYFANIAAAGWLTDITYETPTSLKSTFGEFAYYPYFIKKFLQSRPSESISIHVLPDRQISDVSFFLLMNGNSVGPFERFISQDSKSDGAFHLITCHSCNRLHFFFILLLTVLRLGNPRSLINHQEVVDSEIYLPDTMPINVDGEQHKITERKFRVLSNHLQVFTANSHAIQSG